MLVDKTSMTMAYDAMEALACSELPTHTAPCPHCGNLIRMPTVARQSDLEDFAQLMSHAQLVLERHGYHGKLLAEVMTECHIQIAKKKKPKS